MAIQWADDFSRYGTGDSSRAAMLDGLPYANIGGIANSGIVIPSPDPNDSGRAFRIAPNGENWPLDFRIALRDVVSGTCGIALRAWLGSLPDDNFRRVTLIGVQRANGEYIAYMRIEQNGAITIVGRVSGSLVQIADSVNPIVSPGSFNHYEFVHNRATGAGQLFVNGIQRLTWTGVDTADNIVFVNCSGRNASGVVGPFVAIKDLVIWDSTGTQNNSIMGTVVVRRIKPDADVTLGSWTTSGGSTAFNLLAKDAPNDSTFVQAVPGAATPVQVTFQNLPPDITSVRGLVFVTRSSKTDGGDGNIQTGLSPNGTNWNNGADRPISTAFTYNFDVSQLDPATGSPWTPVAVDALRGRINRTL